jgi:hypothetical protein
MANWELRQVGPPNKVVTLNDYQAPFGRLRKAPVVDTVFELRATETYYAGLRVPTRHIFGDKESDIVLKGRWSDKYLGVNGANELAASVKDFVQDAVQCTVKWGAILAYTGLVYSIRVSREDARNLAWEMTIKVDEDLALRKQVQSLATVPQSIQTSVDTIVQASSDLISAVANNPIADDLNPSFLDQITSLVSTLRNATSNLVNASADIDDYLTAARDQLARLQGTISGMETAVNNVTNAVDTATVDAILFYRTAETDYEWAGYKSGSDIASNTVLYELAVMDKQIRLAQRGDDRVTTRAQDGDTWELISERVYGQADGAATLRQANGVTYGQLPTPGQLYVVPLTATTF